MVVGKDVVFGLSPGEFRGFSPYVNPKIPKNKMSSNRNQCVTDGF